jgi:hypothetical protein
MGAKFKLRCCTCRTTLLIKSCSLDKKRIIVCPQGHENVVEKKSNGKFVVN